MTKRFPILIALLTMPTIWFAQRCLAASSTQPVIQPATLPATRPHSTTQSTQPTSRPRVATSRLSSPPPPKPHVPPAPKGPFSLTETATESESALLEMRGIEADLNEDNSDAVVQEELPILKTEIDGRLDESTKLLGASPSLQLLGTQEQDWLAISQELDQWKHLVKRRQEQLDEHNKSLMELRDRWEAEWPVLDYYNKFGTAQGESIREAAGTDLSRTQSQIDKTTSDLRDARLQIAQLQQGVDAQAARVLDILDSVRRARDYAFNRLFARNSPPLWQVPLVSKENVGVFSQGLDSFYRQLQAVIAYMQRRYQNVAMHVAVLVVLAMGLFRLRHQLTQLATSDPAMQQLAVVFSSPIAASLMLTFLASDWFYPQAPRMFWAMIGAAALIPTVIILRRLIDPLLFRILDALVVFYFLDQVRAIVAVVPVMARFLLMLEMLGGALLLIWFIRSTRGEKTVGRLWDAIRFVCWLWTAVFIVAFLGVVVGFESLANLMGDAALGSAYLAVILFACTRVLASLIAVGMRSRPFVLLGMVRRHQPLLLHRLRIALYWLGAIGWIVGVLASLSMLTTAWAFVHRVLSAEFSYGSVELSLGHVLAFLFTVWISFRVSRFLRFVLEEDVYDRFALPGGIPYAISKMVNYSVLLIGFFVGISALGYDMTKFTILAGAFGVGLGFGMQNIVNNFVSGLILLFERPVRVGDVIQMDDTVGVVGHIGIRASIIRTSDSSEIIVPNGNLISGKVTNWTLSNRQRGLMIPLTLTSTAEPTMVIELLNRVAAGHPLVTKQPSPQAFLTHLGADSFSYELHVWTNNAERWVQLRSELAVALNLELAKEKILIK